MSGDVQPRKRKDKKRKKDELGIEEPRGTAAALGEGDVFMHTGHDHGTGGHWCAKVIFFSLLAILVTLIGLIILENRGLSELEANSVESRYSGVLEGWLEDAPDDDHHDEHTLELNHHDDDDEGHEEHAVDDEHNEEEDEATDDDEHDDNEDDEHLEKEDEDEGDDDEENPNSIEDDEDQDDVADNDEDNDDDQLQNYDSQEQDLENDEDDEDEPNQETYQEDLEDDADENSDLQEADENDVDDSLGNDENEDDDENNSNEIYKNEFDEESEENEKQHEDDDDHEEEEEDDHDEELEVEKLEKEIEGLEPVSTELPALPEEDDDDDDKDEDQSDEKEPEEEEDSGIEDEDEAEEFLEIDDADEPPVEKITVPAGNPFDEVEEEVSSEQPPDTLEEEEEYEKRQEELRREEAQASHMWLKLGVGGALLVATHAVMRRATHRDTSEREERPSREETPVDRRLTLIPEEPPAPVRKVEPISRQVIEKPVLETVAPVLKSVPIRKQESEEDERQISEDEEEEIVVAKSTVDKELYSDEEPEEDIEEEEEEEVIVPVKKEISKPTVAFKKPEPEPEPEEEPEDDEDPEDVEIIGDDQLEEELEEEGDEEEISDVDDAELLTRLEAKYGRLPEPERPGQKKDGGNSIDDLWPGEPSDAYWRQQLDSAEEELRQGSWSAAAASAGAAALRGSGRARFVLAKALDLAAEAQRDNRMLTRAIAAYLDLLKMNDRLSDKKLLQVSARALDRIQFRGTYLSAEPVYRLLIRRFPNEPAYRNNLTISFLMANRVDLAEETLKETLQRWPKDRVALAHYAFVLKTKLNKYEEAAELFKQALEGDTGPANEPRFYYHYGDSLLLLGRPEEAHEVHKRGAKLGHFLSPSQRSLYNVDRLKSTPWWDVEKTPYLRLARALEKSWQEILKEGEAARALYEKEKEGLKERGDWSQLDLFVRGQELPDRCARAPVTCSVIKSEPAAAGCRRGQIKFSLMAPGTHVRAHVGPTNCRLRMHLGLSNTKNTYIRVDKEIRQWQVGKVLMFDDSFEHEVWHNGTGSRLVLIVDVWHPQLTALERRQLPAI